MPEQHINEFTVDSGIGEGVLWHIQRLDGIWGDQKIRNSSMFGLDIRTHRAVYAIQDLVTGTQMFQLSPDPGKIYMVVKGHAIYRPGNINDGANMHLLGRVGYEAGGGKVVCMRFTCDTNIQGAPLASSDQAMFIVANTNWFFDFGAATTASTGTVEIWASFAVVTLP